jgi:signal peptidase I
VNVPLSTSAPASALAPAASVTERRTPLRAWRENIEALVMAIAMALFLKHFVIEAYKIPTGSMQPTLIGDEEAGIQDRILVDKLSYLARAPERWEVAVFRYPLDRAKSFVKRIVGVGPEELSIRYGDLWRRPSGGTWEVLHRPRSVQAETWKRLDRDEPGTSPWIAQGLPRSSRWTGDGRRIEARGTGSAAFRGGQGSILDGYLDGYPPALLEWIPDHAVESGTHPVGDLRVAGMVRALPGLERFAVVLKEGSRHYRFELAGPAAGEPAEARVDAGPSMRGAGATGVPYRLPAGRDVRFAAQNLDDRLELEIDGEVVLSVDVQPAEDQTSAALLTLEGEGADLEDLGVWRDIYYIERSDEPVSVPAGSFYMLGDNTQDSSDSREWTLAQLEVASDAGPVVVRGNWRSGQNPRDVYTEPKPLTTFVDEWGERHWFAQDAARRPTPLPAPFVPREMIQGKALAVFWPLDPLRGVWRLKWVN